MAKNISIGVWSRIVGSKVIASFSDMRFYLGELNGIQEGFPPAYEVMPGNTTDKSTLKDSLARNEAQYGKAERVWVMNRGIPTEEMLGQMRQSTPPVRYLVGTPKGKLTALEKALLKRPWQQARPGVRVKLLPHEGEAYVLAESADRIQNERSMRRRRLHRCIEAMKKSPGAKTAHARRSAPGHRRRQASRRTRRAPCAHRHPRPRQRRASLAPADSALFAFGL